MLKYWFLRVIDVIEVLKSQRTKDISFTMRKERKSNY